MGCLSHTIKLHGDGDVLFQHFRLIVKLFAEISHVNTKRTQSLTNSRSRLGTTSRHAQSDDSQ